MEAPCCFKVTRHRWEVYLKIAATIFTLNIAFHLWKVRNTAGGSNFEN